MSRAEEIATAIGLELARRQDALEDDRTIQSVTLTVKMSAKTGKPFRVLFDMKCERDLTSVAEQP